MQEDLVLGLICKFCKYRDGCE